MSGLSSRASISARQITSEAIDEPPGLSTRRTIALTPRSSAAWLMYSTSVSEPATSPLRPSPDAIVPTA